MEDIHFEDLPNESAEKKSGKRVHRLIMLTCGAFLVASGLAAGYLAFTADGGLPGIFYATHPLEGIQSDDYHLPSKSSKKAGEIQWVDWGPEAFAKAEKENRLVLLDWTASWSHECHLMDELTYNSAGVRQWIEEHTVPVRVDSDEKPYLARYLANGWPTTALLLPTGEMLSSGAFMPAGRFIGWAKQTESTWRSHPEDVEKAKETARQSAQEQRERLLSRPSPAWIPDEARVAFQHNLSRLEGDFDATNGGFGKGRKFLSPQVNRFLAEAKSASMLDKTLDGELKLMDPVWGGLFRYSETPDWRSPRYEKLLDVQAEALRDFSSGYVRTKDERYKRAAEKIQSYLSTFLQRTDGFFAGAQDSDLRLADGGWLEGARFYSMTESARLRVGTPAQIAGAPVEANAQLADALILAGTDLEKPDWKQQGEDLADALWKRAVDGAGQARHRVDDATVSGLLEDELALAHLELTAERDSGDGRHLRRFLLLFKFIEQKLSDPQSGGYLSVPVALRNGPESAWPAVDPDGTALAALNFIDAGSAQDNAVSAEAARLLAWSAARPELIEPNLYARLALRAMGER